MKEYLCPVLKNPSCDGRPAIPMKGHIRKRGNLWNIVVDAGVHPEAGRRRQKWYSARTKRLGA